MFDENGDGTVDQLDRTIWVRDHKHTWVGDADLSGEFNSSDLVVVFQEGKYETGTTANWRQGDFNGDQFFNTADMVAAFQDGGYELGPRAAVSAVPEPSAMALLLLGWLAVVRHRRRDAGSTE